ncbi:MAG: hypothetical protein NT067_04595 [Candidatus Diapherotrites archaeon]|nr:hypothetical protein [Candidatus Diapherotrites archaeon]
MLRESAEIMVRFVHGHRIPVVVAGGASGELALFLFKEVWKNRFPNEPLPDSFSLAGIIGRKVTHAPESDIEGIIRGKKPDLVERLKSAGSVFILEEYSETGTSVARLRNAFHNLGAKGIKVGCFGLGYEARERNPGIDVRGKFIFPLPIYGKHAVGLKPGKLARSARKRERKTKWELVRIAKTPQRRSLK